MNTNVEDIADLIAANLGPALMAVLAVGVLLGIIVRGLMGRSRIRRAEVDKGIAQTELKQVQEELDALFAAQRKRQAETATAVTGDTTLQSNLEAQEKRTAELTDELSAARDELEKLRAEVAKVPDPVIAAVPAQAPPMYDEEAVSALTERNQWLEDRVSQLEADFDRLQSKTSSAPAGVAEEELAKLRWRNRYLEGRLAYYEDGLAEANQVEPANPAVGQTTNPVLVAENDDQADDKEDLNDLTRDAPHPSDAVLAALNEDSQANGHAAIEPLEPPKVSRPSGEIDDLTQIGGIGPRIEEVLHELGIWSFEQIAGWSPEHAAWVEQQLSFHGRVSRENWIDQAKELV